MGIMPLSFNGKRQQGGNNGYCHERQLPQISDPVIRTGRRKKAQT